MLLQHTSNQTQKLECNFFQNSRNAQRSEKVSSILKINLSRGKLISLRLGWMKSDWLIYSQDDENISSLGREALSSWLLKNLKQIRRRRGRLARGI